MCDGTYRPIEKVAEGDWVVAQDPETGALGCQQVVDPYYNPGRALVALELEKPDGEVERLETTDNHPFYVEGDGWTRTDELSPGDRIPSADGGILVVAGVSWTGERTVVFNFGVEGYHTYFVGESGAWVHNCFPFDSLRGKSHKFLRKSKPKGWREVPADNGKGWKWLDKDGNERFRFMRPQKGQVQWQREKNGYMRWRNEKGEYLDADGNVVPRDVDDQTYQWETHIPYEGIWP
jgi:hypothetical protein